MSARASSSSASSPGSFDHGKVSHVRMRQMGKGEMEVALDLPTEELHKDNLPSVTIVTVTRNRKALFKLAIDNWKRIYYPYDKLSWIVVDDSDDIEDSPIRDLKELKDKRIKFYYLKPEEKDGKKVPFTVGHKRNLAMDNITTEFAAMMDDDDFFYDKSIIAKACILIFYKKSCVYSDHLAVYNPRHESSYIMEKIASFPEGTCMISKEWWQKQKFDEKVSKGEGLAMVRNRELDCIKFPYYWNMIAINHGSNHTALTRRQKQNSRKTENQGSTSASSNFWKEFPDSFQKVLKEVAKNV